LREEQELQVFETKMPRKISGPKKDEVSNLRYYTARNIVIYRSSSTVKTAKSKRL
jgi:hypothetical protein